jgi:hypothetical protein
MCRSYSPLLPKSVRSTGETWQAAGGISRLAHDETSLSWQIRGNAAMHTTMARALTSILLGLAACAWLNFAAAAASDSCKDCNAQTGLTIREQIKADRAREVDRVAKESADRPWDGKDFGQAKRQPSVPVVR